MTGVASGQRRASRLAAVGHAADGAVVIAPRACGRHVARRRHRHRQHRWALTAATDLPIPEGAGSAPSHREMLLPVVPEKHIYKKHMYKRMVVTEKINLPLMERPHPVASAPLAHVRRT